ncbi:glycoside hydrolase family 76 protein [Peniophora sp. CONT]|nr:glycoside hydrolase family 76 protein [Peniophora sp. CONT]
MLSLRALCIVACSLSVPSVFAAQCAATLSKGTAVANRLQSYYSTSSGSYNGGGRWTDANAVEDIHNFMLGAGVTTWENVGNTWDVVTAAQANANIDWYSYNQGFNDDAQWLILALYKIFDYKNSHGQASSFYLDTAKKIYSAVAAEWDTGTCGGGVWWNTDHGYKNAITNELFLYTSARGYQITGDATYLANAQKTWTWLKNSGMRNSQGLWNDGLDSSTCQNNGQNTWTYNQGVILSGLGQMYQITGDSTYITEAQTTIDAVIAHSTVNGVIKEICDDSAGASCNGDSEEFKGAFMKHLQYFLDNAPAATQAKYKDFVTKQYNGILSATNGNNDVGTNWYSGTGGSVFGIQATDSGLAGITNAAKWGAC